MLIVGIETSGLVGSVALYRDGQCLEFRSLQQTGRRHAQALVLELREILAAHQATPRHVDAIAVSRGPGSFTGLRVGMVCAKTFAYATGCQFVAVDTFAVVAMNCPPEVNDVWIVEDAQRGELFTGQYRRREDGGGWILSSSIEVVEAESWLAARGVEETIAGRGLIRCDLSSVRARCLPQEPFGVPLASNVALEGERMLLAGGSANETDFDFWKALPFYIRRSAAEEVRDRAASGNPELP
jgi:tRNA threonylcarbamoyladenosine biosynthesis protein TsaB